MSLPKSAAAATSTPAAAALHLFVVVALPGDFAVRIRGIRKANQLVFQIVL